ncbi:P-loop containing nucleoside triphosphate hydrolase protein [Laetiporus sulphureus 93-53]|uniref:p-loop containing nucleoside triphosphate hydrolase protein n=1 Tax=Laetiporus sulphureus 93-53 TaxID=1314785 RepID=A0A165DPP9_9APHY|nr:P-loop containing nucleoside triphosphate hydrolase protein [Laetiporus sulphureus 93-53]KZT05353.1 P-loop containing nucleoside triphosphate hydrolase protein [Laetiporus sulphureus 93-53]
MKRGGDFKSVVEPIAVRHMRQHVLAQLSEHRARFPTQKRAPPLMVGVQGPQGSGKTLLTTHLLNTLTSAPDSLSLAVLSIDDLYLPHSQLVAVAAANPDNRLLRGRGQPGTHDLVTASKVLRELKEINDDARESHTTVVIPRFDKSLYGGEGDRVDSGTIVHSPLDVVILEGWCVGFYPISTEEIERRWGLPVKGLGENFFGAHGFTRQDIIGVNERLKEYVDLWNYLGAFIQIKPEESHPYTHIYKWRLQQEHYMKSSNGGRGMADHQVTDFVDRYIPGYVFFGDGVTKGGLDAHLEWRQPRWLQHGLVIEIDENRHVVHTSSF